MKRRADGRYEKSIQINKTRHTFYAPGELTQRQAEKHIKKQLLQFKEKEEKGLLYSDVAAEWWTYHIESKTESGSLSPQTRKRYNFPYEYSVNTFGSKYIKEITTEDIDKYIKGVALTGLSKKTVKMYLSIVNQICCFAYIKGYINANPCMYISAEGVSEKKRQLPDDEIIERIKKSINCTFGTFAYFLLYTGLRKGEALALTWQDIDFKKKIINVNKSLYYIGNKGEIKAPKTEAGIRQVILLPNIETLLKTKFNKKQSQYIFPNDSGDMLHSSNYNRLWNKYKSESGIEGISAHSLRHAYCTILYDAGIDIKTAQELMGHSCVKMTQDVYTHISNNRRESAQEKLINFVKVSS